MERAAVILWWAEFISMLRLSRCAKPGTTCFWHLLEGNGFFRARLAARGSYRRGPSPGEGAIERDEPLSRSSKGDAEDDETRRICERNARRQGRHIGQTRDRPMSANAMVLTVMIMSMVFTGKKFWAKKQTLSISYGPCCVGLLVLVPGRESTPALDSPPKGKKVTTLPLFVSTELHLLRFSGTSASTRRLGLRQ